MKTLLLFDIDGTLLQVDDATRQAMNKAFSELFGLKNPQQNVPFAGRTDLGIFKDVALTLLGRPLSGEELKQVADRYLELLPEELDRREFRLMPGVTQLLPVLAARKEIILGLETGNLESAAYMKLKRGGMDRYFSLGGFGSDSEDRAELVRKGVERARNLNHGSILDDNIFLIGDSPYDIIAGRKAGINTIGVCTGHADRNILLAESPSYVLSDLSDILAFLRCIGF
jgi:phosphoglycolate phosphatase-like HAD superfamily hydrolase